MSALKPEPGIKFENRYAHIRTHYTLKSLFVKDENLRCRKETVRCDIT